MVQAQAAVNTMQVVHISGAIRTAEAAFAMGGHSRGKHGGWRYLRHRAQMHPRNRPGERIPEGLKTCFSRSAITCSAPGGGQMPRAYFISSGHRSIIGAASEAMERSIISREQLTNSGNCFGAAGGKRAR